MADKKEYLNKVEYYIIKFCLIFFGWLFVLMNGMKEYDKWKEMFTGGFKKIEKEK